MAVWYAGSPTLTPTPTPPPTNKPTPLPLWLQVPIKPENVYAIDHTVDVQSAAAKYEAALKGVFGADISPASPPAFDLVLLGMGPDGHTASLFPGHALCDEVSVLVAAITDSPKPPPERITLTLPVINASKATAFVCTGGGKAENLAKILSGQGAPLPAGLIKPKTGTLTWFVDDAAVAEWSKM
jgi:6-phosphogluconolactonase